MLNPVTPARHKDFRYERKIAMRKIIQFTTAAVLCLFLTGSINVAKGQDASHPETATSQDASDWGLLGLIGLIGLLGLKKKKADD